MATHDYVIDNQSAPSLRADLNNALQAIVTQNSSATAPTTTYADMVWYDTTNNQIKKRNEANSGWITLGTVDESLGTFTPSGVSETFINETTTIINTQTFNSSGTWTKPASGKYAIVELWGGGGSGRRGAGSGVAGGGGGGAYKKQYFYLADLPSTVTVTIGAGGAAVTASGTNGNGGGTTTFGSFAAAYGGGGGSTLGGGGGGGSSAASLSAGGIDAPTGTLRVAFADNGTETAFYDLAGFSEWLSGEGSTGSAGGGSSSTYGGAAGGALVFSGTGAAGGNSTYGGAGGGGGGSSTGGAGGVSTFGGNGSAGATGTSATLAGSQPAGGSGGAYNGNVGKGGDGRVVVTVI